MSNTNKIFVERFDLSNATDRFADKRSAHFIGAGFKSFWVSSASRPDFKAKLVFNPHRGSDAGSGLTLGLNMSMTLSEVVSSACIEIPNPQSGDWIEITFSPDESLSVGSVSVDLKVPPTDALVQVGPVSAPLDGKHIVFNFTRLFNVTGGQDYRTTSIQKHSENSLPNTGGFNVPSGYKLIPLSYFYSLNYSNASTASATQIELFVSTNNNDDSTGSKFVGISTKPNNHVTAEKEKFGEGFFSKTSHSDPKAGYINEGELFNIKLMSISTVAASNLIAYVTVIGKLVKK